MPRYGSTFVLIGSLALAAACAGNRAVPPSVTRPAPGAVGTIVGAISQARATVGVAADAGPLAGAIVLVRAGGAVLAASSDERGQFRIDDVSVGSHEVMVVVGDRVMVRREIEVRSGAATPVYMRVTLPERGFPSGGPGYI